MLLSGDQILPTISTVIRFPIGVEDNPLRQYLDSLTILKELNPTKIMPAHGEPFNDMDARIEQLLHHHQEMCIRDRDKAETKNEANAGMEEQQTATQSIATKRIQRRFSQNIHDQMEEFN